MFRMFVGLAVFGMALFISEGVMGFLSPGDPSMLGNHLLLGVFVGIYLCGLHTLTMFHLIGTAKDTKEAAQALPEYADIVAAIRRSKMKVFPIITLTIFVTILTVVLGGGIHTGALPRWVHHATVTASLILNLYTFFIEYVAVKHNLLLMTVVDYKVSEKENG
jgi:hypothetical protein